MNFTKISEATALILGKPWVFMLNVGIIAVWAVAGPPFHFSDTWQLVVNTGTTVFTYLMLFVLQASSNRDTAALQAKLDEIIRALPGADQPDIPPE